MNSKPTNEQRITSKQQPVKSGDESHRFQIIFDALSYDSPFCWLSCGGNLMPAPMKSYIHSTLVQPSQGVHQAYPGSGHIMLVVGFPFEYHCSTRQYRHHHKLHSQLFQVSL